MDSVGVENKLLKRPSMLVLRRLFILRSSNCQMLMRSLHLSVLSILRMSQKKRWISSLRQSRRNHLVTSASEGGMKSSMVSVLDGPTMEMKRMPRKQRRYVLLTIRLTTGLHRSMRVLQEEFGIIARIKSEEPYSIKVST